MKKNTKVKTKAKEDIVVDTPVEEIPKEKIAKIIETLSTDVVPEEEEKEVIKTLSATIPEEIVIEEEIIPDVVPEEEEKEEEVIIPIMKVEAPTDLSKADDRLFRRTGRR